MEISAETRASLIQHENHGETISIRGLFGSEMRKQCITLRIAKIISVSTGQVEWKKHRAQPCVVITHEAGVLHWLCSEKEDMYFRYMWLKEALENADRSKLYSLTNYILKIIEGDI